MSDIILSSCRTPILVDEASVCLFSKFTWNLVKLKGGLYAVTCAKVRGKWATVPMHDAVMAYERQRFTRGKPVVDHINRNTLDNRRTNLRVCTFTENLMNSGPRPHNKTGYKGVYPGKRGTFVASIKKQYRNLYLGSFKTPEEAADAYNRKAYELYGEFAYQNPIPA